MYETTDEDPLQNIAKKYFEVPQLFPLQRLVISNILEGIDQIVVLPTGGGKSLCFQLPALLLDGATLVITPLLSLLKDQVRRLSKQGVAADVLRGGMKREEKDALWDRIIKRKSHLLYATPEAAISKGNIVRLRECEFSHLVIDEAHCVFEWGESFRPAYLKLNSLVRNMKKAAVSAFTATASILVIDKIRELVFGSKCAHLVTQNPDRPNIRFGVVPTLSKSRELAQIVRIYEKPMLIFAATRRRSERYAKLLLSVHPKVAINFYHAGLSNAERNSIENWFLESENGVLVSTSAYGMGVDKGNVRTVVHVDLPRSIEAYVQEIGRAGRDGGPAEALLLYSTEDIQQQKTRSDELSRRRLVTMIHYALSIDRCRREFILSKLGYENSYCSGCDVCSQTEVLQPAGFTEVRDFVIRNRRAFTHRETVEILKGDSCFDVKKQYLDRVPQFGTLRGWRNEEIEEALASLLNLDILKLPLHGFWKNRLSAVRRFKTWQERMQEIYSQL